MTQTDNINTWPCLPLPRNMPLERHDGKSLSSNIHHVQHKPPLVEPSPPIKTSNWKSGSTWSNWPVPSVINKWQRAASVGCEWNGRSPQSQYDHPEQNTGEEEIIRNEEHVKYRKFKKRKTWHRQTTSTHGPVYPFQETCRWKDTTENLFSLKSAMDDTILHSLERIESFDSAQHAPTFMRVESVDIAFSSNWKSNVIRRYKTPIW